MEIIDIGLKYKGTKFIYKYKTKKYYDLEIANNQSFNFILKDFDKIVDKEFDTVLYEDYLINPVVFGIIENNKIIAYIELAEEDWNNRLRVSGIFVEEEYRNNGIGNSLMNKAIEYAIKKGNRAVVLETQSCNYPAISFYKKNGFEIIGFDNIHYSNNDILKKEIRIEMGKII